MYQVLVKDISILETLAGTETLVLNWNTKATALWDMSKNRSLRTLEITDFSKIHDLGQLALATQLTSLVIGGGIEKPMKIESLQPLSKLTSLRYLALSNLKVADDTLAALGGLINLGELEISNLLLGFLLPAGSLGVTNMLTCNPFRMTYSLSHETTR